jgi:DNA-binding transcriptional regulator YiaG
VSIINVVTPAQLKIWRNKNNYSQTQLAKILGVDIMTVSRWERGVREIPPYLHLALECMEKRKEKPKAGRPSGVRR